MTATYTFDVFMSLDGYGSYGPGSDWGGYWGKQARGCSSTAWGCTAASSGWSSEPTRSRPSRRCWPEHRGLRVRDPWVTRETLGRQA